MPSSSDSNSQIRQQKRKNRRLTDDDDDDDGSTSRQIKRTPRNTRSMTPLHSSQQEDELSMSNSEKRNEMRKRAPKIPKAKPIGSRNTVTESSNTATSSPSDSDATAPSRSFHHEIPHKIAQSAAIMYEGWLPTCRGLDGQEKLASLCTQQDALTSKQEVRDSEHQLQNGESLIARLAELQEADTAAINAMKDLEASGRSILQELWPSLWDAKTTSAEELMGIALPAILNIIELKKKRQMQEDIIEQNKTKRERFEAELQKLKATPLQQPHRWTL
ncbi:hypothetical protein GGI35DRAFT_465331 [Trichoderma velutinum]